MYLLYTLFLVAGFAANSRDGLECDETRGVLLNLNLSSGAVGYSTGSAESSRDYHHYSPDEKEQILSKLGSCILQRSQLQVLPKHLYDVFMRANGDSLTVMGGIEMG